MLLGANPDFKAIRAIIGPMGRSVADVERVARILFGERGGRQLFPCAGFVPRCDAPQNVVIRVYLNGTLCTTFEI